MRLREALLAGAFALATVPSVAKANCLTDFSCTLHGECRLPCVGGAPDSAGVPDASAAQALGAAVNQARAANPDAAVPSPVAQDLPETAHRKRVARAAPTRKVVVAKKAEPVVTIAAADTEVERLKAIPATMPDRRIRMLGAGSKDANLFVDTANAGPKGKDETRIFAEDVHVVAAKGVGSFADLAGKQVSFGPEGSASQAAGRKVFAALDVKVQETPLDVDNALDGVSTGDVAAVVVLAPPPYAKLRSASEGVHLLSVPNAALPPQGMSVATIPASAYPDLSGGNATRTFAVDATLRLGAKGTPQATALLAEMSRHSDALAKGGLDLLKADAGPTSLSTAAR